MYVASSSLLQCRPPSPIRSRAQPAGDDPSLPSRAHPFERRRRLAGTRVPTLSGMPALRQVLSCGRGNLMSLATTMDGQLKSRLKEAAVMKELDSVIHRRWLIEGSRAKGLPEGSTGPGDRREPEGKDKHLAVIFPPGAAAT